MLLCLSKCPALVLQLILQSCQCAIMASRADNTYRREKESATTTLNTKHKTPNTVPLQLCHQNTVALQLQHADPSSISFLCCQGAARSYTRSEQIIIELFLPPTNNVRGRAATKSLLIEASCTLLRFPPASKNFIKGSDL